MDAVLGAEHTPEPASLLDTNSSNLLDFEHGSQSAVDMPTPGTPTDTDYQYNSGGERRIQMKRPQSVLDEVLDGREAQSTLLGLLQNRVEQDERARQAKKAKLDEETERDKQLLETYINISTAIMSRLDEQ